jgi:putative oxidoreductase
MTRILFGGTINEKPTDQGLLLLRVVAGVALAWAHGLGKVPPSENFVNRVAAMGMPAPELFAWLAGFAELGGGLLLAIGLLTRPVAALLVLHFVVVVFLAHSGDPFRSRELALLFGTIAGLLLFSGAGRYSVDRLISPSERAAGAAAPVRGVG